MDLMHDSLHASIDNFQYLRDYLGGDSVRR